jgi:hypothetical protein
MHALQVFSTAKVDKRAQGERKEQRRSITEALFSEEDITAEIQPDEVRSLGQLQASARNTAMSVRNLVHMAWWSMLKNNIAVSPAAVRKSAT